MATIPLSIPGLGEWTFTADIVGNKGGYCPGVLPNSTLRHYNMSLFTNMFDNGDGILAIAPGRAGALGGLIRALLTESGHYLLPIDAESSTPNDVEVALMRKLVAKYTTSLLHSYSTSRKVAPG